MSIKMIKNILIVLLCVFFLLSGVIVFSLGTEAFGSGLVYEDVHTPYDLQAMFPASQGEEDGGPEQASDDGQWSEDPFRGLGVDWERSAIVGEGAAGTGDDVEALTLALEGVSFGGRGAFAVINGKTLAPGESIAGYRVEKISLNRVVLEKEGCTFVLTIWDDE